MNQRHVDAQLTKCVLAQTTVMSNLLSGLKSGKCKLELKGIDMCINQTVPLTFPEMKHTGTC